MMGAFRGFMLLRLKMERRTAGSGMAPAVTSVGAMIIVDPERVFAVIGVDVDAHTIFVINFSWENQSFLITSSFWII